MRSILSCDDETQVCPEVGGSILDVPLPAIAYDLRVQAGVQIPGGLPVPGERRYRMYEFMMTIFEHLKATGRFRLVLLNGDRCKKMVEFDPNAI